ncbi:VOC family protein [Pseudarthrobacter sulfonivorans]|uniref:VOC family protein n=1 Tax=Pseudarthrobacter sulfonivorans TaxID=121292 RepID=UPI00285EA6BF|nr:VOC family protein [Pseudarthrobacter sulfonivorans]MDR6417613.1 catechol 2,3-dioxygenase-like lactoylglutathione lyase family enzyme [Pseudarthrobacter sulfonivorans]
MLNDEVPSIGADATPDSTTGHRVPMGPSPRVEHVGMMVPHLDEGVDWYVDNLGFTLQDRWSNPDAGMEWAHLKLGDFMLELVTMPGLEDLKQGRAGYHHLAIRVSDCAATVAALEARGVTVMFQPSYFDRHDMDWSFIQDFLGNVIEIVSYRNSDNKASAH